MSLLENLLQLNQLGANVDQTRAATRDTNSQAQYRDAQQKELLQKLTDADALKRATMNAQALTDNQNAGMAADGMGPPTAGGGAEAAAQATDSATAAPGQTIGDPTGPSAQAALIKRNMQSSQLKMRAAQQQADAFGRIGNSTAQNKALDDVRAWQTQIDTQATELGKTRADIANKLSSAAGSVLDNGANLPQVLAAMDELQPGLSKKLPIDRNQFGMPVWSPKTANALKTMQDEGLKAVEQYSVKNDQMQRQQEQQRIEQADVRNAREQKHEDETAATSRGNLKVAEGNLDERKREFDYKQETDTNGTPAQQRMAFNSAKDVAKQLNSLPSVKWFNTNSPSINDALKYANDVSKGTRVTTTQDQALMNTYAKVILDATPRSVANWKIMKENNSIPESIFNSASAVLYGQTLSPIVRRDMANEIRKKMRSVIDDAGPHVDQAAEQIKGLGLDPKIFVPNLPRDSGSTSLAPKEQAAVDSLLSK
jgi:hypothetical protein